MRHSPVAALPIPVPVVAVFYVDWKRQLLRSCPGESRLDVADMDDDLLNDLFKDGCAPTLLALLHRSMFRLSAGQA
jgi:hypothetical protein